MSKANRVGKQNARERVAAAKIQQRKADRARRQWIVGGSVVAVVAVAVTTGLLVQNAKHNSSPFLAPVGAVVDPITKSSQDLGIQVGSADAPVKMTVFEDFRCPACKQVEQTVEPTYKQYIEAGKLQVIYHPVRLIDDKNGGSGSWEGGNAAACAQDAGQFVPLHDILYANQPDETTDGYGDTKTLLSLAGQIPALKSNATFLQCVKDGQHKGWVTKNADTFNTLKLDSTPTFYLQGAKYSFSSTATTEQEFVDAFKKDLDAAFTKAGGKAGTPVTLPSAPTSPTAPATGGTPTSGATGTPTAGASGGTAPTSPAGTGSPTTPAATEPSGTPTTTKS